MPGRDFHPTVQVRLRAHWEDPPWSERVRGTEATPTLCRTGPCESDRIGARKRLLRFAQAWNPLTPATTDIVENDLRVFRGPRKFDQDAECLAFVGQAKFLLHFGQPLLLVFVELETRQYDPVHSHQLSTSARALRDPCGLWLQSPLFVSTWNVRTQRQAHALPFCCCGVKERHRTVERKLTVDLESAICPG